LEELLEPSKSGEPPPRTNPPKTEQRAKTAFSSYHSSFPFFKRHPWLLTVTLSSIQRRRSRGGNEGGMPEGKGFPVV
jgi:hypothetical protein